ncbi:MAG: DUF4943 domain-containing protein [Tannerella sp.]|jgi:hypothetical protein|nr:DUF4943 domain-containing protein [Tannerella sp.]
MRICNILLILVICVSISSCQKDESDTSGSPDVEAFIKQLKSGKYDAMALPEFTYHDIPALLEYRDKTQLISEYPVNPISSFWGGECELGTYALWIIESIRVRAIGSNTMGFPSQNPIFELKGEGMQLVPKKESHRIASDAYYNWWITNKHNHFYEFCHIDPLADTNFRWH